MKCPLKNYWEARKIKGKTCIYLHNLFISKIFLYSVLFTWYGAPPISFIEKPIGKSMAARQKNITENKNII